MGLLSTIGKVFSGSQPAAPEVYAAERSKGPELAGESLIHPADSTNRPTDGNSFVLVGDVDALNLAWRQKMGMSS